jgi:hypothetical protein
MCMSKPKMPKIPKAAAIPPPAPLPPPPPPPEPTPEAPVVTGMSGTSGDAEELRKRKTDSNLSSARRTGTRALRIDLLIPGFGSGLNIPS